MAERAVPMRKLDVVGFGALNLDRLYKVNRIAAAEEESFVIDYSEACGGSAANTVVGVARLGCRAGFIGKTGDDDEGETLLQDFLKEGVDTSGIIVAKGGRSGKVMGFVDRNGQRALYIDPGVNDTINPEDVNEDYILNARFLHLTSFAGNKSLQTQRQLVDRLNEKVKVSFDPGALYARLGPAKLKPIIDRTFLMMPNSGELELLTGVKDYRTGATRLLRKGVQVLAVKLGGKGCYVTNGKESHLLAPFKVKVVDTTGAGDAFDAGFLFGFLSGRSLSDCGRIANFVASRCIMKMGARTSLPRLDDLKAHRLI
jgi:sugar/nucleoside kinase (ribokinase family)